MLFGHAAGVKETNPDGARRIARDDLTKSMENVSEGYVFVLPTLCSAKPKANQIPRAIHSAAEK